MKIEIIETLSSKYENKYNEFVENKSDSLIYWSLKWREILKDIVGDESEYLIALDDNDRVVGCIPIFFKKDEYYGTVANSLPYYGSHGGILADADEIKEQLLDEYIHRVKERNCVASTIVGSPLVDYDQIYRKKLNPTFVDERIELMTYFPYSKELPIDKALMEAYHYKVRNAIRKAVKSGIEVRKEYSVEVIDFLHSVHRENMLAVGGLPKEKRFFDLLDVHFEAGKSYDIYVAYLDDTRIAAMLVFYYNGTVEYFTPAIVSEYRNFQPLSLLIYAAMQEAMKKGMKKWNWGGTGVSQTSLYTFKSRWGTTETRYYYYTKIWDKSILKVEQKEILQKYNNYYVYPFHKG